MQILLDPLHTVHCLLQRKIIQELFPRFEGRDVPRHMEASFITHMAATSRPYWLEIRTVIKVKEFTCGTTLIFKLLLGILGYIRMANLLLSSD